VTYSLEYTPAASRQLAKLDKGAQTRLKPKIKALSIVGFLSVFSVNPLYFCK